MRLKHWFKAAVTSLIYWGKKSGALMCDGLQLGWRKKPVWLSVMGFAAIVIISAFGVACLTTYNLAVQVPVDMYFAANQSPWRSLNVSNYEITSEAELNQIEPKLLQAVRQYPDDLIPAILLGRYYRCLGQYAKAIAWDTTTLKIIDESAVNQFLYQYYVDELRAELSLLHYLQGSYDQALVFVKQIEDPEAFDNASLLVALEHRLSEPDRGEFHYELGVELRSILQIDLARQEFETAITHTVDPVVRQDIQNYMTLKMPSRSVTISPKTQYFLLAGVFQESVQHNLAKAQKFYSAAVQAQPSLEWAHSQLGIVRYKQQNYSGALDAAYDAIALNPNYLSPYLTLGDVEIDRANYSLAIAHYEKALTLAQQYRGDGQDALCANIENQIGFAYEQLGAKNLAVQSYQRALALAGEDTNDYTYSQQALNRIQSL